jgi:two-component system, LuxR family, sensor kinase FixL
MASGSEFQSEQERAAERRFRLVVEAAPNAMVMVNQAGEIVLVNAETERVFGYKRSELLGKPVEMLVPERYRASHPGMRGTFFAAPRPRAMGAGRDLYGLKKDGGEFPVEIGLNPFETDEGLMVLSAIVDITERKAAEQALRSVAAIVESSADAIIGETLDGIVTSWNKAAERTFGYTAAEMIGQSVLRLAVSDGADDMIVILNRIKRGGRVEHYETRRRHKDGTTLDISLSVSPIYDGGGQLIGASKVARDITAAKSTEAALKESQSRLQELHAELLHASRLSVMGQMASTMAHELNQPLTAVVNYLEAARHLLATAPNAAERVGGLMQQAAAQAERAGGVIRQLRQFVAKGETQRRPESLNRLVEEALALALVGARQSRVRVTLELEPELPPVLADGIQIQQVVLNLVRNAIEAMEESDVRELVVETHTLSGMVEARVLDTGPGISPELMERLFQPFVTTKKTGMGLGLSICREIAEAHQGHLTVVPRPEGGTVFRLTLPMIDAEDFRDAQ